MSGVKAMAKKAIAAVPVVAESASDVEELFTPQERVFLQMLEEPLAGAILVARRNTNDLTIMCRIGEHPEEDQHAPGVVSIHRDGHDTVYFLTHDAAVDQLLELT